ncbi:MAG TPA: Ada metal-binding domain-containing protein [Myxococcales bacterium]|nr:Ada metal-binding domain-containing protein [Myxococcales bacterium]
MNAEAAWRAVEGRDQRFAGRFFLGVRTTGVFCRPGCPARTPRRENVVFFDTAGAARDAGFRACLRCRPEAAQAPDTGRTLARALRLLEESGDAAGLADKLGMTDRHLRRIFSHHLGASPAAVLRTRRLELARQLVEGSQAKMIDIAHTAGFQSLRSFNEAMRRGFGRAPTRLRAAGAADASFSLRLAFSAPLDFEALLAFLGKRALPGLEAVADGAWQRTLPEGTLEVRRTGASHLMVRLPAALAPHALPLAARVRRVFDLRADPDVIEQHLAQDSRLRPFLRPGLRIPGAWDPFEMAVRAILGQQISVERARFLAIQLREQFGGLTPQALAGADIRGMPGVRAQAIEQLARAVLDGRVRLDGSQPLEQLVAALCELPGIGDWTAQLVALRGLGEPDAFPAADLGLCQAMRMTPKDLRQHAERWRPWRGYAAAAIWLAPQQ